MNIIPSFYIISIHKYGKNLKKTWEFVELTKTVWAQFLLKKTDISFVEPQLWANARESVFEKMPFLTLLNKMYEVCEVKKPLYR